MQKFRLPNGEIISINVPDGPTQEEGEVAFDKLVARLGPDADLVMVGKYMMRLQAANLYLTFLEDGFLIAEQPVIRKNALDEIMNTRNSLIRKDGKVM